MKYNKEHNFFHTPNKLNSYWAGFIAADGSVSSRGNCLTISLAAKDKTHLEKFSSLVSSDYVIKEFSLLKEGKKFHYVSFSLSSMNWKKDLYTNWKITPRKTFTLEFPQELSTENTKAFICGYIDGDGCIYHDKKRNKITLSICGNLSFLEEVKKHLSEISNIRERNIYPTRNIFTIAFASSSAMTVLDSLYDEEMPLLARKWDKYLVHKKRKYGQYIVWSKKEEQILIDNHAKTTIREIHKSFFPHRSYESVEKKSHYLGLKKHYEIKWNEAEDRKLKELRENTTLTVKEIHEKHFSYRTYSSIRNRVRNHKRG